MPVYNEPDKKKWTKDKRHWYFRCTYEDINGNKKRYKSKMYFSRQDAEDEESLFLIKTKNHDSISNGTLFNEVFKEWLFYKKRKVKSSTYYEQKKIAEKHILSEFKNTKLFSIKESTLNQWYEKIEKSNYSTKHKNKIIGFFREILTYAKETYNFNSKIINLLHNIKDEKPIKDEIIDNYWTYDEFNTFIKYVDDEYYSLIFNFLYYTGLRVGEMIALNWHDLNFKNKTLTINKTLTNRLGNGSFMITSPKTKNSVRSIDLSDNIIELLKNHYNKEKKIYGFNKDMFIFGNVKHLSTTTLRKYLKYYIDKVQENNFKSITIHGFRHSHVSLLIYLGAEFRDVAERVGDTVSMVQNTYYHMYPEDKSKVIKLLNNL